VLKEDERARLINNIANNMRPVTHEIKVRQLTHFLRADKEYGIRIAEALEIELAEVQAAISQQ